MAANNLLMISLAVLLLALIGPSHATDFEVGADDGWIVPPAGQADTYNEWASKNRFLLGDSVHFKYKKDSVMVVTEEEYNKCASAHPIFFSNNGDTEVHLDHPGLFYFISGVTGHCERGQKMAIKVIGPNAPPPAPPAPKQPSGAAPASVGSAVAVAVAAMLLPVILRDV